MFLQAFLNGIIQVLLFTLIPFVWWLFTARKRENFFCWLGVKKPVFADMGKGIFLVVISFAVLWGLGRLAIYLRGPMEAADSQYKGKGIGAFPAVLAYSFIQTALSEEILFRGFLLKRLTAQFGFTWGVIIQAAIFGLIHLLMVWGHTVFLSGMVIVLYPMGAAVLFAYINEKLANGSILPGWMVHGLLNALEGLMQLGI